ncbi:hypothetical protein ACHHYP_04609 [Achlya hypogyna]|uniref:Coiled-coil SMC6 And NSE5 INteracting (CANIN) domain-containing protein n=1 Tax=Achlya hypogyna TaxID=1202772 RepID=A0A1V9Z0C9_ACHHY|nr:hypothetical protein ACHHYP_04609 [Achlya hypogyna]
MRRSSRVQAAVLAAQVVEDADAKPAAEATTRAPRKGSRTSTSPSHPRMTALKKAADTTDSDEELRRQLADARPVKKRATKRKDTSSSIALISDIDALLASEDIETERRKEHARKLQRIRQEAADVKELSSAMDNEIAANLKDLQADEHLFSIEKAHEVEQFGYIFEPMTQPLPVPKFTGPLSDPTFGTLFKAITDVKDDMELGLLLHSKVVLLYLHRKCSVAEAPTEIWEWLLKLVSSHVDSHIVRGAFLNLFLLMSTGRDVDVLTSGLPMALFAHHVAVPVGLPPHCLTLTHFLRAFQLYGFAETKRALSSVARATARHAPHGDPLPFPSVNMEYTVAVLIVALRTGSIQMPDFDTFCAVIFFLRLQFEDVIRPQLLELTSYALEALLDQFSAREWRRDYARKLIKKIASVKEGFFQSAAGWLTIARRLPRTERGTQLTTGLAVYVLQHRIDVDDNTDEEPLEFPVKCEIVLDIVASIVDSLTSLYAGTNARETAPPYEMICMKIGLMDLALQAYLNEVQTADISLLLGKLDQLADTNKAMQCEEWHQLKTLVSLMHRKYAPEHLRIGRPSPKAKTVLFLEE